MHLKCVWISNYDNLVVLNNIVGPVQLIMIYTILHSIIKYRFVWVNVLYRLWELSLKIFLSANTADPVENLSWNLNAAVNNFAFKSGRFSVFLGLTSSCQRTKCPAQLQNAEPPGCLKPVTPWLQLKYSTTEPPRPSRRQFRLVNNKTYLDITMWGSNSMSRLQYSLGISHLCSFHSLGHKYIHCSLLLPWQNSSQVTVYWT